MTAYGPLGRLGAWTAGHFKLVLLTWIAIARLAAPRVVLDAAVSFAAGALGVLPVLIAVEQLDAGEAFAGLLGAGAGAGALMGGVAAGSLINRDRPWGLAGGVVAASVALGLLALTTAPIIAIGASALACASLVMLDTLNVTALQRSLPQACHGRAFGLLNTSAASWLMAGSAVPPILVALVGVEAAVALTGLVVLVLGTGSLIGGPSRHRERVLAAKPSIA